MAQQQQQQQQRHVPKFGDWGSEDNVPYTAYFDKARKGRAGGKIINPNDPQENPDLLPQPAPQARASPARVKANLEEPVGHVAARNPQHDRMRSREEGEFKQFAESPARHERRPAGGSTPSRPGDAHRRHERQSAGSENSLERSPLHHQAKRMGGMSPAWEGKNSYDSSHGSTTPGRSKMRPSESAEQGAAVPKFGDWDENNPASADGFTHIFDEVRRERQNGGRVTPGEQSPYNSGRKTPTTNRSKSCCFPWGTRK